MSGAFRKWGAALFVGGAAAALQASPAAAVTNGTVGFQNIFPATTSSETAIDDYVSFFSAEISDLGSSTARVLFRNDLPTSLLSGVFIGKVYVDDPTDTLQYVGVNDANIGTVDFAKTNDGGGLPQGEKIGFSADAKYKFEGGASFGVQSGEALSVDFEYASLFDDFLSSILSGDVRFGLHIQGIPGELSDSIVSPSVVPIPAGVMLLVSAFGVAVGARRLHRRR